MKYRYLFISLSVLVGFASCKNDDSDFEELLSQSKEQPIDIFFYDSYPDEEPEAEPSPSDSDYNDYIESFTPKATIEIAFSETSAQVTNPSSKVRVSVSGAHVTADISNVNAEFMLTGSSSDGSLKIIGENRFSIVLDGVSLNNPAGAAINNQCKKTLYIHTKDGTANYISSQDNLSVEADAKGCIFSEGQISFSGLGLLNVSSNFRNGIASDDYIVVHPGSKIKVQSSTGNGLKANDGIKILGGTIDILVDYDGGKGINSEDYVEIKGGRTTIINQATTRLDAVSLADGLIESVDTINSAGVKCDTNFTISSGQLLVKCTGNDSKGIKTNVNFEQSGGEVKIVALGEKVYGAPKGIKADGSIIVSGGLLYSYSRYSYALDADGQIDVYAYSKNKTYVVEVGY